MNIRRQLQDSTIWRSAQVLSTSDRRKVIGVVGLQISFGLLDLCGVAVIGMIGALAISGVGAQTPGNRVSELLRQLHLEGYSLQTQATILGLAAALLLVSKTLFSVFFTRRTIFFLSRRAAVISSELIGKLFGQSLLTIQSKSMNEMMYSVTQGVSLITVGVLGTSVTLISDTSLLLVMAVGLFVVDPMVAFSTFVIFGAIGFILYRLMHVRARELGLLQSQISIKSNEKILEAISSYRETVVRNRREYYARVIGNSRLELANVTAELSFMPNISKYVMEVTVVVGFLAISAVQFAFQAASHAVAVLSVFLAASTRIAPAVLRIQQGAISVRASLGGARPTLELVEQLESEKKLEPVSDQVDIVHEDFNPEIRITNVNLTYPGANRKALNNVNLKITPGQIVAIVGPSGAGKTSIVDVLLGVLNPDSGQISICNLDPLTCIAKWPGALAYVPQDVVISNGTIRENVAMGFPRASATDELVRDALRIAQLDSFTDSLSEGIDTHVGDRGTKISGGQRQRLGIARAMFTRPQLLVLDEATSALDGETEADISDAIQNLRGSVTVLMIAHRLSTVRKADRVIYMAKGQVITEGSFADVRQNVPDFDKQAKLMGL